MALLYRHCRQSKLRQNDKKISRLPLTSAPPCVTRDLLALNARLHPSLVLLKFDSGEHYTSVQLMAAVRRYAAGLQALGVQQDDYVLSWLPNSPLAVLLWLALNELGAVYVPINIAYKGRLLQHVIKQSGATLMIGKLPGQVAHGGGYRGD